MKKSKKVSNTGMRTFAGVLIAALAVFGFVQLVRAATGGVQGQPGVTKYDAVSASDKITTEDESYTDMPGMVIPFTTTVGAPVAISVSVASPLQYSPSFPGCGFLMQAALDGVPLPDEVPILFQNLETRGFTYIAPAVSAGTHTATVQWRQRKAYFGSMGCAQSRSMVVEHQ